MAKDGISTGTILLGALVVGALFAGGMYLSSTMSSGPAAPEKIQIGAIEPAPPPPDATELSERVRTYFMKGNAEECMERHLGHDQRLEGQLAIELLPEGKTNNGEAKTEPANGGVALCIQQRFANGFAFNGPAQRVSYTFSARWESGRIALGQNVTTSPR